MFGFSSVFVIFKEFSLRERLIEGKDFDWTRSRVLEKLSSLPGGTLPDGVQPIMGPDATASRPSSEYSSPARAARRSR